RTFLTFDSNLAVQHSGESIADREAKTGSAVCARRAPVDLTELLEDHVQGVLGNAYPGVFHRDFDALAIRPRTQRNSALFGELGSVPQEIDQEPFEYFLICIDRRPQPLYVLDQTHALTLD